MSGKHRKYACWRVLLIAGYPASNWWPLPTPPPGAAIIAQGLEKFSLNHSFLWEGLSFQLKCTGPLVWAICLHFWNESIQRELSLPCSIRVPGTKDMTWLSGQWSMQSACRSGHRAKLFKCMRLLLGTSWESLQRLFALLKMELRTDRNIMKYTIWMDGSCEVF